MIHAICRTLSCCALGLTLLLPAGCGGPTEPTELPRADSTPAATEPPTAEATQPSPVEPDVEAREEVAKTAPAEPTAVAVPEEAPGAKVAVKTEALSSDSTRTTSSAINRKPLDLTFDDIKFDIKPGDDFFEEMLPESVTQHFGKRIRIRGYILPSFKQSGLTQFVLVRDNMECCFGPGAALYDCIRVEMEPGKATEFSIRPVAVEGVFQLEEFFGPDDKHLAIYYMTGEAVK